MHTAIAVGLLFFAGVSAEAGHAQSIIVADIAMSEWTPPEKLRLDLDSGRYNVALPSSWPAVAAKPQPRNGVLNGKKRDQLRLAFTKVMDERTVNPECNKPQSSYGYISNAGTPQVTLTSKRKVLVIRCWTQAELSFYRQLDEIFRRRRS